MILDKEFTNYNSPENTLNIEVRRWFRRSYGGTYFTFEVTDKQNKVVAKQSIPTYGYGSTGVQKALKAIELISPNTNKPLWQVIKDNNIGVYVYDVKRKRDLHQA